MPRWSVGLLVGVFGIFQSLFKFLLFYLGGTGDFGCREAPGRKRRCTRKMNAKNARQRMPAKPTPAEWHHSFMANHK